MVGLFVGDEFRTILEEGLWLSRHLSRGTGQTAEIRTENLPNTSIERCRCTSRLGDVVCGLKAKLYALKTRTERKFVSFLKMEIPGFSMKSVNMFKIPQFTIPEFEKQYAKIVHQSLLSWKHETS
jgi:hypothetical protein